MVKTEAIRRRLEQAHPTFVIAVASVAVGIVAALDALTGPSLSFSFFYVLPLAAIAWRLGRTGALVGSVVAATTWFVVDITTGPDRALPIPIWNTVIRIAFFLTITVLLVGLRTTMARETELARIDPLTRIANRRAFAEAANRELARIGRTGGSITIALIDLDDLKLVNDGAGHEAGDDVLGRVATVLSASVRGSDLAARVGGDEFALLLCDTGTEPRAVLERVLERVRAIDVAVTTPSCSIGAAIVTGGSLNDALRSADAALYDAKRAGKGRIRVHQSLDTIG